MTQPQMNTNNLKRMVELTVSLHKLILNDMDESDEGENIRDESDKYWDALSEEDKDWLRRFSASLYDMTDGLQNSLRWIPVTEKLPPQGTDVDFLTYGGYDGYGHAGTNAYPNTMFEYESGPYNMGKDDSGHWGVTHWRLRPGQQPDMQKFIEDNS